MPLFVVGDATKPVGTGKKIIVHVCNDIGAWGAGFVIALSKVSPQPEKDYLAWAADGRGFMLGSVKYSKFAPDTWVANMIAQHGCGWENNIPPIRYEALAECLSKVCDHALAIGASVHMPRIGCGLAGGDWPTVEELIKHFLCDKGVVVTVYDLPPR